jgi:hypothetical protein
MTRSPIPFLAAGLLLSSLPAQATEVNFSGFGTLGYARTDQPYVYQRYMDEDGTLARDSVLGLQMTPASTRAGGLPSRPNSPLRR